MSRLQGPPSTPEEAGFTLRTERLGPLPLINHFIERVGLHDVLSRHVASDVRCAVSHTSALGVLLRSIIVEREPIATIWLQLVNPSAAYSAPVSLTKLSNSERENSLKS